MAFDLGRFAGTAAPTASLSHRDTQGRITVLTISYVHGPEGMEDSALPGPFAEPARQADATAISRDGHTVGASSSSSHAVQGAALGLVDYLWRRELPVSR
jgi:hypothetical protein